MEVLEWQKNLRRYSVPLSLSYLDQGHDGKVEPAQVRGHYPNLVVVDGESVAAVGGEQGRVEDADDGGLRHL